MAFYFYFYLPLFLSRLLIGEKKFAKTRSYAINNERLKNNVFMCVLEIDLRERKKINKRISKVPTVFFSIMWLPLQIENVIKFGGFQLNTAR